MSSPRPLRYTGATVLLVLAVLLAPLATVATWVSSQISDSGRYVQTVAPLATEPSVQSAVTDRLTNRVVGQVDVQAITNSLAATLQKAGAPPLVVEHTPELAGPLKDALTKTVHKVVSKVVTSDQFSQLWDVANRQAHAAVVKVLTGEGNSAVQARGNTVVLDIGTVVDNVKQHLVDAGFKKASAIPQPDRTITLLKTDKLQQAQTLMRLLDVLGVWLPVVALVCAALGIWVAPAHRVALLATAIGTGVMMAVLLIALAVLRGVYLDSVPPSALPENAAAAVFDTLVRFLRQSAWTLLVVAVIVALTAALYGPSRAARSVRSGASRGTGSVGRAAARRGMRTGTMGRWLETHRGWTTGVVIAGGALALILWNYPTAGSVALVLGIVLLVLVILGVLAAAGGSPVPTPPGADRPRSEPAGPA
ncbi:hypothetical protein [Streptomyces lydicus]|uniref:hypothetical protein n=1 Tax=Streptomyces lydicus TaxID=47763 RepID=UPI00342B723F